MRSREGRRGLIETLDLTALFQRLGRTAEAVPRLAAAVAQSPDHAGLQAAWGAALAEAGPAGSAMAPLERATALQPNVAAHWSNLGKAYAAEARWPAAEQAFERGRDWPRSPPCPASR